MTQRSIPVIMFNVNPEPKTGGELYYLRVLQRLRALGVNIRNISIPSDTPCLPRPIRLLLGNFTILLKILRLHVAAPAILFEDCSSIMRFTMCNWLAHKRGIKIIILLQSLPLTKLGSIPKQALWRGLARYIMKVLFRHVNIVLTNSEKSTRDATYLGCAPNKIKLIYCGFDIPFELDVLDRKYDLNDRGFRLLLVGNVVERKGLRYLVKAMAALNDFPITLDVVGSVEYEPGYFRYIRSLICENGLDDQVTFHGHIANREQVSQLYRKAALFVLPSLNESFGIVLMEAMSFGLPIITTTVGANSELVEQGVNGLLVPPRDPVALASAIVQMASSAELRRRLGQAGYKFVARRKKFYSWAAVGDRVLQAMESLY